MTEYLVQHWNIIRQDWINELATFHKEVAIRKVGSLYQEFPYEKFRILKCEPLEPK